MPISVTNLINAGSGSSTSVNTASISPVGNNLILVGVVSRFSGGTVNTPTLTGDGYTWVSIASVLDSGNHSRITLFRGLVASPSSGALTIDFAGQNQEFINWNVDSVSNVLTTGTNGSGAVIQSATAQNNGASVTGLTATLGAFATPNNGTYGYCANNGGINPTADTTNFTSIVSANAEASEYATTNKTSVDFTWASNSSFFQLIAIEIGAIPTAGGSFLFNMM